MFTCILPQSYQYSNLWEGADSVGEQLRGDKECPLSNVTNCGRSKHMKGVKKER